VNKQSLTSNMTGTNSPSETVADVRSASALPRKGRNATFAAIAFMLGMGFAMTDIAPAAEEVRFGPLPVEVAMKAAQSALTACSSAGYRVTVSIVDREGVTRVFLVGDGAGPISVTTSRRKAYTAAALGVSTGEMAKHAAASGHPPPAIDPEILALAGGLPIISHEIVVGGIGVGGADISEKDEACARAGLESIKDQLN
jgi:uncharacterized protein GlcG (DUF336 family)